MATRTIEFSAPDSSLIITGGDQKSVRFEMQGNAKTHSLNGDELNELMDFLTQLR